MAATRLEGYAIAPTQFTLHLLLHSGGFSQLQVSCFALLWIAMLPWSVQEASEGFKCCFALPCCALFFLLSFSLLCFALCSVLCRDVLCGAVLYCAVLSCTVLCFAVLCCAVLRCAVLCCAVLCCGVLFHTLFGVSRWGNFVFNCLLGGFSGMESAL